MLPSASLPMPSTWRDLLEELAPVFARRSTHRLFVALACGMILADRSTVVAMAAAGGPSAGLRLSLLLCSPIRQSARPAYSATRPARSAVITLSSITYTILYWSARSRWYAPR